MNILIRDTIESVLHNQPLSKQEAMNLIELVYQDATFMEEFLMGANQIRDTFMGNHVDLCTIMNAKSGRCSEDCTYCAQSVHYKTEVSDYHLLDETVILQRAKAVETSGVKRFSLVTSGRSIKQIGCLDKLVLIYKKLNEETSLSLCASHGMATKDELIALKNAGVSTYHHNVETVSYKYNDICKTHGYRDRIDTIKAAFEAELNLCSGGIIGMGETMEDRIAMAIELRELGIKSVPINVLMPVKGTPLAERKILEPEEILLTFAIYRYLIPDAFIRYAGGRMALNEFQLKGFRSGVNAALIGDFLTTVGSCVEDDKRMILEAGLSYMK